MIEIPSQIDINKLADGNPLFLSARQEKLSITDFRPDLILLRPPK